MSASQKDFRPKARRPRGFQDRRGAALARERDLVAKISTVYEAWGFEALETPAFEYADALGKFLPDQDRPNEGVFALEDDDAQWMALRYDLTAPLARFVAENYEGLPKPYRRWAAGPVWRNEKPGPGRFREFWQCDADTVGSASPAADAELIAMACAAYEAAGASNYILKISSRGLLDGILASYQITDPTQRLAVLRAIDKIDRLGLVGVRELLGERRVDKSGDITQGARLPERAISAIMNLLTFTTDSEEVRGRSRSAFLDAVDNTATTLGGQKALSELREMDRVLRAIGVSDTHAKFDISIVRGLEYYTGAVFEAQLIGADGAAFGSIGGGGRYDDLVARFTGQQISATGFSIGVSRLAAALATRDVQSTDGPIVVLPFDKEGIAACFGFAARLRAKGWRAEVYLGGAGPKAQLKYADRRNAPIAVILGGDERANGQVTLKDLMLGAQRAESVADNKEWRAGGAAQITVGEAALEEAVARILKSQRDA